MDPFLELALDHALRTPDVEAATVTFPATDGALLAGTRFTPPPGTRRRGQVVIASATAVPRGYYAPFSRHLAEHGFGVLTFDYRGIGGSRPRTLRGFAARMRDWGRLDLAGALDFVAGEPGGARPLVIGHSVGGQIAPLAPNLDRARGLVLVGAQSGDFRLWQGLGRARMAALWFAVIPALTSTWGYLPGWTMGGEPLPRGVATEWASWGRRPGYLVGGRASARRAAFARLTMPLLAYSFADDDYAPRAPVESLLALYAGAAVEHRHLAPRELGARQIGHFGFFRERVGGALWPDVVAWLARRADDDEAPEA